MKQDARNEVAHGPSPGFPAALERSIVAPSRSGTMTFFRRVLLFVGIAWSIAGAFQLLSNGGPWLLDRAVKAAWIPDGLVAPRPHQHVDCSAAVQGMHTPALHGTTLRRTPAPPHACRGPPAGLRPGALQRSEQFGIARPGAAQPAAGTGSARPRARASPARHPPTA